MSELIINVNAAQDIDWLIEATNEVMNASENDFTAMQEKKWYKRLWETVTFSKDNQMRVASGVSNLAKLQEIIVRVLTIMSKDNADVSDIVRKNSENISRLSTVDALLLKEINKVKYGSISGVEFTELDREKKVILANLLAIADSDKDSNEDSRRYISAIMANVNLSAVDNSLNVDIIETLNKKEQELLYRLIMTNRYLMHIEYDEESDVVDNISISSRRAKEICTAITETAKVTSPEFFAAFYEASSYMCEEISECDISFCGESIDKSEGIADISLEPTELEEITISSIMHIAEGNTFVFRNKIIHFRSMVNCEGNLIFENCYIHYNETETADEIKLTSTASLGMKWCTVENHAQDDHIFLKLDRYNDDVVTEFTYCEFINCCSFFETRSNFALLDCKVINPGVQFIRSRKGKIVGCEFVYESMPDYIQSTRGFYHKAVIECDELYVAESSVIGDIGDVSKLSEKEIHYLNYRERAMFSVSLLTVEKSTFIGIDHAIRFNKGTVKLTEFQHCVDAISSVGNYRSGGGYQAKIEDCVFDYCVYAILLGNGNKILNCQFNYCYANIVKCFTGGTQIEFCEFNNWQAPDKEERVLLFGHDGMIEMQKDNGRSVNRISDCVFNGMVAHNYYVIAANANGKIDGYVGYIENCSFANCTTDRENGNIIKVYDHYYNLFNSRKEQKMMSISSNCRGLDRINTSPGVNTNVVRKKNNSSGNPVGRTTVTGKVGCKM